MGNVSSSSKTQNPENTTSSATLTSFSTSTSTSTSKQPLIRKEIVNISKVKTLQFSDSDSIQKVLNTFKYNKLSPDRLIIILEEFKYHINKHFIPIFTVPNRS